jgi:hypothetical protein
VLISAFALGIGLLGIVGCATEARRNISFAPNFADDPYWATATPRDPTKVIMTDGDLLRKHTVKGIIRVNSLGSEESLSREYMRNEAAARGIDAVIKIKSVRQSEGQSGGEVVNYVTGKSYGYSTSPDVRHYLEGEAVIFDP